jgi:uncharacterized membrane protein YdbT with pleckstrin-like domain
MVKQEENKKHKYFENQFDDEKVLYVFHKHPIVMRKGLIFGMLGPLAGVLPSLFVARGSSDALKVFYIGLLIGIVVGLIIYFPSWLGWHFSVFILTDQRFIQITQKGFFHRSVADLGLAQIQAVNYEVAGLQETLLGFGTINMRTYVGDLEIKDVHHPAKVQKRILSILKDEGINTSTYPLASGSRHNEVEEAEE